MLTSDLLLSTKDTMGDNAYDAPNNGLAKDASSPTLNGAPQNCLDTTSSTPVSEVDGSPDSSNSDCSSSDSSEVVSEEEADEEKELQSRSKRFESLALYK